MGKQAKKITEVWADKPDQPDRSKERELNDESDLGPNAVRIESFYA